MFTARYRGFESLLLRHIMTRCEPQNKKATSVAFFILLLFARHYNCSDGGRPKYVTLAMLAIPSLLSLRIPPSPPQRRRKATVNTASINACRFFLRLRLGVGAKLSASIFPRKISLLTLAPPLSAKRCFAELFFSHCHILYKI